MSKVSTAYVNFVDKLPGSAESKDTLPRERDDPDDRYIQSYLWIRTIVGFVGLALPVTFIIGEAFLDGGVSVRGSISAYYHSPMRDVLVGGLCVIGVLLATYMSGKVRSLDFWLSLMAGIMVLFVALFPTGRSAGRPPCDAMYEGCSFTQLRPGDPWTGRIHSTAAAIFILSLAVTAFLFAYRSAKHDEDRPSRMYLQLACGVLIILAVLWVTLGVTIKGVTPLYLGEVVAVAAFGLSWFARGRDIRLLLIPGKRQSSAPPRPANIAEEGNIKL